LRPVPNRPRSIGKQPWEGAQLAFGVKGDFLQLRMNTSGEVKKVARKDRGEKHFRGASTVSGKWGEH